MREFSVPALYDVGDDARLPDLLDRNAAEHGQTAVMSRKEPGGGWRDVTATDFLAEVRTAAKGLLGSGVRPGDRVALMARTRYEWALLDFAIWYAGAVSVPVYETSSPEQISWILKDSGAVAALLENPPHRETVESVRAEAPDLRLVLVLDEEGAGAGAVAELAAAAEKVTDAELDAARDSLTAASPATIIYTSGTTGRPKGCVLSHRAFLTDAGNVVTSLRPLFRSGEGAVLLFLPLAHVLARLVQVAAVFAPLRLGHTSDIATLTEDLGTFRPTVILGVPRVFEKVYNSARTKAREDGKGKIFDAAAATAIAYSRALDTAGGPSLGLRLKHKLFDRLVYSKLRAVLGGRATHAISGGAALGERLGHFYRGIGFTVLEGYGLTESCAPTTLNPWDAPRIGTVGRPLPSTTVAIADDGEVLLRGDHLFDGYWKNEAATAEAMKDGWYHTGDIGSLDADGYLTITGRKKEILVTAGGKNVAPAVIEDRIRANALIAECMVVGDSRPFVAALITLDPEFLPRWAAENGKDGLSDEELRTDPELLAVVQEAVDQGNAAVSKAESVRKFQLLPIQFTEDSGYLTPSMKLKRHVVTKDFAAEIDALYRGSN